MNDMQSHKKKSIIIYLVFIITAFILSVFSWYYIEKDSKNKDINPLSLDSQTMQHLQINEAPPIHIQTYIESTTASKNPKDSKQLDSAGFNNESNHISAQMDSNSCHNAKSTFCHDLQSQASSIESKQNLDSNNCHFEYSKQSNTNSKSDISPVTSNKESITHPCRNDKFPNSIKNSDKTTTTYTKNPQRFYKKPKVVIIIDDLANKKDIKNFQSLHLKLTLSLFPKQFFSKNNPDIAKTLEFYMIHLPLEAHNFEQQGVINLRIGDSLQTIESHIAQIKKDFPKLAYINNHTGSRYTESREDMQKLLQVLARHKISFVDSLTTSKSVAGKLLKEQHKIHIARNVFLDNETNVASITKQLNTALKIADKQGYVIAIGHPKQATYQVLKEYKEILLNDYEMLYINELDLLLQKHNISDTKTPLPLIE